MRYFEIVCHRGHCGTGHSTEIKFVFEANNLLEACDKARKMPSVKHTKMVIFGKEITQQEYNNLRKVSAYKRVHPNYRGS